MSKLRSLTIAGVFLVGCAVGGGASQLVVPKATAQQAMTLSQWQYFCVNEYDAVDLTVKANELGAQYWEMVGGDGNGLGTNWCFRRQKR